MFITVTSTSSITFGSYAVSNQRPFLTELLCILSKIIGLPPLLGPLEIVTVKPSFSSSNELTVFAYSPIGSI